MMRVHQTPIMPIETVSAGCAAWRAGPAAIAATTGPATRPMPRPAVQGTGETASKPMSTAPPSATTATTSIPPTQAAVAVDRATINVSSRTSTADQAAAPVSEASVWPHTVPGTRASRNRGLGDTDCISRPHQPAEIIPTPDDVEVDVLAQIQPWVLIRTAEAGHVEIEDDHRRAAPTHRLQQAHPIGVGAGRDDGNGAPRQAADSIPSERLGQWRPAVGLRDRQVIEDEPVLANGAVGFEDGSSRVVCDQANLTTSTVD